MNSPVFTAAALFLVFAITVNAQSTASSRPTGMPAANSKPALAPTAGQASLGAAKTAPIVNSLGMEFVAVPGTKIYMCRTVTRVKDFRSFAEATGYHQKGGMFVLKVKDGEPEEIEDHHATWDHPGFAQGENEPVVGVTWKTAQAFCAWMTTKEARKYRLPTDQEWSAAAGHGKYPWGDLWPPPKGAGNFADESLAKLAPGNDWVLVAKNYDDGAMRTSPVGSYPANALGLFDMAGNVWQWCEDPYKASMNSPDILEKNAELKDERNSRGLPYRVARGSSWSDVEEYALRTAHRLGVDEDTPGDLNGFRCVIAVGEMPLPK